ncbi:MAG: rhodanese-like domain-containing protein [Candidatus Melainabacteria bacterium]
MTTATHIPTVNAATLPEADIPTIVDVRTRDEFLQEHIPGSVNIPLDEITGQLAQLRAMPKAIISCRSGNRAGQACQQLEQLGLTNLQLLDGGILAWKGAGRPTLSLRKGYSIMQQVQIIVGLMVLTGLFVPGFWPLALLAGMGMLVAGLTNTCMMAVLLAKMPWNQSAAASAGATCSLPGSHPS